MATPEHASPASSAPSSATPSAGQKRPAPPPEPQLTRTGRQQRRKTTDEYVGYGRLLTRCIEMWTLPSIIFFLRGRLIVQVRNSILLCVKL